MQALGLSLLPPSCVCISREPVWAQVRPSNRGCRSSTQWLTRQANYPSEGCYPWGLDLLDLCFRVLGASLLATCSPGACQAYWVAPAQEAGMLPGALGTVKRPSTEEQGSARSQRQRPCRLQSRPVLLVASACLHLIGPMS